MIILFRVGTPRQYFFENLTQWCMAESKLTPKFKYSMLLCCQIQDILSIYTPTRELDESAKMIIPVSIGTLHWFVFVNWIQWCMTDSNPTPKYIIAHYSVVEVDKYLVHITQLDLDQFTKMINMFRVGTPQPFIFKIWTQWCMTGLKLTPHFKYITIIFLSK